MQRPPQSKLDLDLPELKNATTRTGKRRVISDSRRRPILIDYQSWLALTAGTEKLARTQAPRT
jgi:hypothetical protein